MTLAQSVITSRPRFRSGKDLGIATWAVDAPLLAAALAIAGALFFQGGLEALIGAATGTLIGAGQRKGLATVISGGFAGLFVGAMFAALFHSAIVGMVATFF